MDFVFKIEFARKNMNDANQKVHDAQGKLYNKWVAWTKSTEQNPCGDSESTEVSIIQVLE